MAVEIMIMSGVNDGQTLRLEKDPGPASGADLVLTIGRYEDSDIFLNEAFVSRNHAVLRRHGNRWSLEDCGSTNGTFLEADEADQRVRDPVVLEAGRLFRIGRTWLRLQTVE